MGGSTLVAQTETVTETKVVVEQTTTEVKEEAAKDGPSIELFTTNNLWMMIAAALVFIMHLGFASLEAGLTRSKNTVNILTKNLLVLAIGIVTYTFIG
ncbi:MAG TPA: ammonium transporter, partial [Verrucomicrobia subdivision 6 bacterium]|nr:ammonium transporter [Verrucomicrobia subdivision 6 bacterium]